MSDESFNGATRTIKFVSVFSELSYYFQLFLGDTCTLSRIHDTIRDTFENHFALTLYCCLVNCALCLTIRIRTGSSMERTTTKVLIHMNHKPVVSRIRTNVTDPILRMRILIPIFQIYAKYWRMQVQIPNHSKK